MNFLDFKTTDVLSLFNGTLRKNFFYVLLYVKNR